MARGEMAVRSIGELAARIHRRMQEFERRHDGQRVPISPALSRILEHAPDYEPYRARVAVRRRRPVQNPGVFNLQKIADTLETTVGDLLGEPERVPLHECLTTAERRSIRDAARAIRRAFDLDDPSL